MDRRNFIGQLIKGVGAAIIGSGLLERCTIADLAVPNTPCGGGLIHQIELTGKYDTYAPLTEEKLLEIIEEMLDSGDVEEIGFNI